MGLSWIAGALGALGLAAAAAAQPVAPEPGALDFIFDNAAETGAVLVHRLSDGAEWTGGGDRVDEPLLPASTFKIVNSLILLEAGVVADPDTDVLAWDGVERRPGWDADQSLRTGFRRSAVWAYQHWARALGHADMAYWVERLDYGNAEIGPEDRVDRFWLEGPLAVSAREQVAFLTRLHGRALPISPDVQAQVIDIMEHDRGEGWVLRAKTGWAVADEPNTGWFVGWLETETEVWVFALNMDLNWESGVGVMREHLARQALVAAGAPLYP